MRDLPPSVDGVGVDTSTIIACIMIMIILLFKYVDMNTQFILSHTSITHAFAACLMTAARRTEHASCHADAYDPTRTLCTIPNDRYVNKVNVSTIHVILLLPYSVWDRTMIRGSIWNCIWVSWVPQCR